MKPYVIFAPHVDDEMIGCYSMLAAKMVSVVYYFYDLTEERRAEAINCSIKYDFVPEFVEEGRLLTVSPEAIILVPSLHDVHPGHKKVNRFSRHFKNVKNYYSVDMNHKFEVLSADMQIEKKHALITTYPSQSALFSNEKYYLFERLAESDTEKMIWVTFQKEGIHCYPAALTAPGLSDVRFLGHDHRHMFHFKVAIEVFHDDRDIEFIQFKRWLVDLYDGTLVLNHKSCEMLADELASTIQAKYEGRRLVIDVSEDGENGATVEYQA